MTQGGMVRCSLGMEFSAIFACKPLNSVQKSPSYLSRDSVLKILSQLLLFPRRKAIEAKRKSEEETEKTMRRKEAVLQRSLERKRTQAQMLQQREEADECFRQMLARKLAEGKPLHERLHENFHNHLVALESEKRHTYEQHVGWLKCLRPRQIIDENALSILKDHRLEGRSQSQTSQSFRRSTNRGSNQRYGNHPQSAYRPLKPKPRLIDRGTSPVDFDGPPPKGARIIDTANLTTPPEESQLQKKLKEGEENLGVMEEDPRTVEDEEGVEGNGGGEGTDVPQEKQTSEMGEEVEEEVSPGDKALDAEVLKGGEQ